MAETTESPALATSTGETAAPARQRPRPRLIPLPGRTSRPERSSPSPAPAPAPRSDLVSRVRAGVPVASFREHADAEAAVDLLAEADLPVDRLAIIGSDLRLVEDALPGVARTTARPWARAAGYGAISGAWLGALVGVIFAVVASSGIGGFVAAVLWAVLLGALFGAPAGLAGSIAVERPRPWRSDQRLLAGRYDLYAPPEGADEIRSALLHRRPDGMRVLDGVA